MTQVDDSKPARELHASTVQGEQQVEGIQVIDLNLPLTMEERDLLLNLLNRELGDARVEERDTDLSYESQQRVKLQETVLRGLLEKLNTVTI